MTVKNTTYYRRIYLLKNRTFCPIAGCRKYKAYGCKYCIRHHINIKESGNPDFSAYDMENRSLPILLQSGRTKPRTGRIGKCLICKKEYYAHPKELNTKKYCSRQCQHISLKTNSPIKCKICKLEIYVAKSTMKYRPRRTCSDKCYRILLGRLNKGKNCSFWRGGVSSKRRKIRSSVRIQNWRKKVFERDNYTCRECGDRNVSGKRLYLNAHHIKSFAKYPKQRFVIKNGLTLCKKCHKLIHNEKKYQKNIN